MWGVAKIFTSVHSKGGFDRTPRTPLATGMHVFYFVMMRDSPLQVVLRPMHCKYCQGVLGNVGSETNVLMALVCVVSVGLGST